MSSHCVGIQFLNVDPESEPNFQFQSFLKLCSLLDIVFPKAILVFPCPSKNSPMNQWIHAHGICHIIHCIHIGRHSLLQITGHIFNLRNITLSYISSHKFSIHDTCNYVHMSGKHVRARVFVNVFVHMFSSILPRVLASLLSIVQYKLIVNC